LFTVLLIAPQNNNVAHGGAPLRDHRSVGRPCPTFGWASLAHGVVKLTPRALPDVGPRVKSAGHYNGPWQKQ
jgi:hypothetical protein